MQKKMPYEGTSPNDYNKWCLWVLPLRFLISSWSSKNMAAMDNYCFWLTGIVKKKIFSLETTPFFILYIDQIMSVRPSAKWPLFVLIRQIKNMSTIGKYYFWLAENIAIFSLETTGPNDWLFSIKDVCEVINKHSSYNLVQVKNYKHAWTQTLHE
jgi:hypothetical protein